MENIKIKKENLIRIIGNERQKKLLIENGWQELNADGTLKYQQVNNDSEKLKQENKELSERITMLKQENEVLKSKIDNAKKQKEEVKQK